MRSLTKLLLAAAISTFAVGLPAMAQAQTATANMVVSASVAKSCIVNGPSGAVNFAAYDPVSSSQLTATGQIVVRCVRGTGYSIALSSSTGFNMTGPGGAQIPYDVFQGASATSWKTTPLTVADASVTNSGPMTYDATVKPAVGADVPVGNYTDTVLITVTY